MYNVVHPLSIPFRRRWCGSCPQVRELIGDFANSRYRSCLKYLADLRGDLQLDLYLHSHLDALYKMVEDKCLMQ